MRQAAIIAILAVASMAGSYVKTAIDRLTWPALTALAITLFSGLLIYTVQTSQTKFNPWPMKAIKLSPAVLEHIRNVVQLIAILILFAVTAVILIAIADSGQRPFTENLIHLLKMFINIADV